METTQGRPTDQDKLEALNRGLCLMSVMDHTGDHRLTWDPMNPTDVAQAKAEFLRLKKAGYMAYRLNLIDPEVKGPEVKNFHRWDGEIILEFEALPKGKPSEVVMSPAMVGG
jgi:hypothetical protein